jgi:hypothetical protein
MDAFEQGRIIGKILGTIFFPFLLSWFFVWLYGKIRKKTITKRPLKIFLWGLLIFIITVVSQATVRSPALQEWNTYEIKEDNVSVSLPKEPKIEFTGEDNVNVRMLGSKLNNDLSYFVFIYEFKTEDNAKLEVDIDKWFEEYKEAVLQKTGLEAILSEPSTLLDNKSIQYELKKGESVTKGEAFANKNKVYSLFASFNESARDQVELQKFLTSFKFIFS